MFFSFDGIDGAGKSTQSEPFCEWLASLGHQVLTCRDPGSTALGEALRAMLLARDGVPIGRRAEMLLYMAARAQLVEEVIKPALEAGKTVVSDRFLLANVVYQGHAGGLNPDQIWDIGRVATDELAPDLTFVLDVPPETAAGRMHRELDRMERQGAGFVDRLRQGYLAEAVRRPSEIEVIDATLPVDSIQQRIRALARQRIDRLKQPDSRGKLSAERQA